MAGEITLSASLSFAKGQVGIRTLSVANVKVNVAGANSKWSQMTVPTTAGGTAIPVDELASIGQYMFKNDDLTNSVDIMTAVSGTHICTVPANDVALGYFPSGVTAPA